MLTKTKNLSGILSTINGCAICSTKHGLITVFYDDTPIPSKYQGVPMCMSCLFNKMVEWLRDTPDEDLLLKVNYKWPHAVLAEAYKRRLSGDPLYIQEDKAV